MEDSAGADDRKTCFIVGPIGDRFAVRGTPENMAHEQGVDMWEKVFEPVCTALNLRPIRADKIQETGEIPEQIFLHLRDADVVIADLSRGNANVMYELGLRHTRDKVTVQIGENERLPFDVAAIRTLKFKRTEGGLIEVRNQLEEVLKTALDGKGTPVTATRLWSSKEIVDDAAISRAVATSSEPDYDLSADEPGFMNVLAEGEAAIADLAETLDDASGAITLVGEIITGATGSIEESDRKKGGFAGRLLVAKKLATDLEQPATRLEASAGEFVELVEKVDAMVLYLANRIAEDSEDSDDAREFIVSVLGLVDAATESEDGIRGMVGGTHTMRKIARDLVPVSRTIERALNTFLVGTGLMGGWRGPLGQASEDDEPPEK